MAGRLTSFSFRERCRGSSLRWEKIRSVRAVPALPGVTRRYPATRMGVEEVIRDAFTRARDYKKTWDEYRAAVSEREKNLFRRDAICNSNRWSRFSKAKRYVHAHCYSADEILMLINVADEFGFKIKTFQHVLEGYKVAKEIASTAPALRSSPTTGATRSKPTTRFLTTPRS